MSFNKLARALFLFISISLASMSLGAESSTVPLIPRDVLFGNPQKTSPLISPNGTLLAYLAPDDQDVLNVWVRHLAAPGNPDIKITSDKKRGVRSYLWQYDSDHILYVQDTDGDENWFLYQTSLSTFETKVLTPFPGATTKVLAYSPQFPDEMLISINKRDPSVFDVYRLNLKTGALDLDTENPGDVFEWVADHQLQVRLSQSNDSNGKNVIKLRSNRESPWNEWLTVDLADNVSVLGFTPDNQEVYLLTNRGNDTIQLTQANLITKEQKVIWNNPKYDISEIQTNPVTHVLETVGINAEKFEWVVINPSLKEDYRFLQEQFDSPFTRFSSDLNNRFWVVNVTSDQHPTRFYLYDRSTRKLEFLFSTLPELEKYSLAAMEPISFQARDGMLLHGYLTQPKKSDGVVTGPQPTIIFVHGGPWVRDSWGLNPSVQWLVNRGYVVLQINYRGSTGYGKEYSNSGNREWGGKMQTDLLDGKEWLVKRGIADPNKVAIMGGSYGGYATLAGLTMTPEEYCCGVDIVGPSNIITLLETIPAYWKPIMAMMEFRIGKLETDREFLISRSPFYKADKIVKPLMIGQGANDPRVKQSESDQIVHAMREKNIPVEYILFPDEGHGFARPQNKAIFYAAVEDFLSKYLGGRREAPKSKDNWQPFMR